MVEDYVIGSEFTRERKKWRVVRIVRDDEALLLDENGMEIVSKESYVMVKSEDGDIDFVLLLKSDRAHNPEVPVKVAALPNLWRRK